MTSPVATQLRTLAQELRKEASVREETKLLKVAQVLSAARALDELRALLNGRQ
jgi:hypothetical protein